MSLAPVCRGVARVKHTKGGKWSQTVLLQAEMDRRPNRVARQLVIRNIRSGALSRRYSAQKPTWSAVTLPSRPPYSGLLCTGRRPSCGLEAKLVSRRNWCPRRNWGEIGVGAKLVSAHCSLGRIIVLWGEIGVRRNWCQLIFLWSG